MMNETAFETTVIARAEPVVAGERNEAIDMLRGVAVLGILVMNIYAFAMPFVAYSNPLAFGGTEPWNIGTWYFTHIFFDQKFMTIFSLLFGAGLIMMMTRAEARGVTYAGVWYRRSFWLLLIGALHGYLNWMGDILFHYALVGMLVFLFRRRSPKSLILIAVLLLSVAPLLNLSGGVYMAKLQFAGTEIEALQDAGEALSEEQQEQLAEWQEMSVFLGDPAEQVKNDIEGYSQSYPAVVSYRQPTVTMLQTQATFFFIIWRVGGVMLLGMALMKLGIIDGLRDSGYYKKMMLAGYGIGLPIVVYSAWNLWSHQWEPMWTFRVGMIPNYVGSLFVALGHIGLVMTLIKSGAASRLMARFAAVGRMAFTNYLMHSVILTTVFYGYGLGLYADVPRAWQMAFVVAVIGFQLWFSPIWLKVYRFGPAEWLWRSLTYWRRQPMRRAAA
jgi:uncharacterized protein